MSNKAKANTRAFVRNSAQTRLLTRGVHTLSDIELLAILLKGTRMRGAHELAAQLLADFGSLRSLLTSSRSKLQRHGLSPADYSILQAALELSRRHYEQLMINGPILKHPWVTYQYLRMRLRDLPHEVFGVIYLNTRHHVIDFQELFRGTIHGAVVHPRDVVIAALEHHAAAVIFVHNHPSGCAEPTIHDMRITHRLQEALNLVDIHVVDHLVIGDGICESFAARGLL